MIERRCEPRSTSCPLITSASPISSAGVGAIRRRQSASLTSTQHSGPLLLRFCCASCFITPPLTISLIYSLAAAFKNLLKAAYNYAELGFSENFDISTSSVFRRLRRYRRYRCVRYALVRKVQKQQQIASCFVRKP